MSLAKYFIDKQGNPYKGTGGGQLGTLLAGAVGGDEPARQAGGKDQYGYYLDAPRGGPSGTGLGFLSSMTIGGRTLDDPRWAADPFRGGKKRFANVAALAGRFLQGEMGPGGYLSDAAQSYETAAAVDSALGVLPSRRTSTESALTSAGLGRRYASRIADADEAATVDQVRTYNAARVGEVRGQRFDAMKAFVDMVNQTAMAEKGRVAQLDMASQASKDAKRAAIIGGVSTLAGGLLGNASLF